mmetsp:Transcript_21260/g.40112  ORF Transcript_21260/g.40112 Transcript_21260/m.40112 type:complete len:111 (+) Transcript_21260:814-1146(+)
MRGIPGQCVIPRVLFLARKALACEADKADALSLIEVLESSGKRACACCKKDAVCFSGNLQQCGSCKAVWYCGRGCQVKHWNDGHKIDCITVLYLSEGMLLFTWTAASAGM